MTGTRPVSQRRAHFTPARAIFIIATAVLLFGGCQGGEGPTHPSHTPPGGISGIAPGACASPIYTISGLIAAYGGEPLAGAHVDVQPYPFGTGTSTATGMDGRYSVCGPPTVKVGLQIWKEGYATAFKYDLPAQNQTIDVVLQTQFEARVDGGTVTGVIRGDEFVGGDDEFGGLCRQTPCKVVGFSYEKCPCPALAEITLRWDDPSTRLALYFSNTSVYFPPPSLPPGKRICCSSPLVATYRFNADFDRFAIGFEQAGGAPPGPDQRQAFELTIRPLP